MGFPHVRKIWLSCSKEKGCLAFDVFGKNAATWRGSEQIQQGACGKKMRNLEWSWWLKKGCWWTQSWSNENEFDSHREVFWILGEEWESGVLSSMVVKLRLVIEMGEWRKMAMHGGYGCEICDSGNHGDEGWCHEWLVEVMKAAMAVQQGGGDCRWTTVLCSGGPKTHNPFRISWIHIPRLPSLQATHMMEPMLDWED